VPEQHAPLREIMRGMLDYIPAKIVPLLVSFLGVTVYTRFLTPKDYGEYILVITIVATLSALCFTWILYVIWRYFARYSKENLSEFLSTIITVELALFIFIACLWWIALFILERGRPLEPNLKMLFPLGIGVLATQVLSTFVLEVLRNSKQSKRYSLYASLVPLGTFILAVFLFTRSIPRVEALLFAMFIVSGILSAIELYRMHRMWKIRLFYVSKDVLQKMFSFGLPQIGVSGSASLLSIGDRYLITLFLGTAAVGTYAAGYALADYSVQIPFGILMLSAVPVIVGTYENKGEQAAAQVLHNVLSVYFIVLVGALFGFISLSGDITHIFLGKAFQSTVIILPWVAAGTFFFTLTQCAGITFQLKEKPMIAIYLLFFSAVFNLFLNYVLIPHYGILGSAYATLIAYFVYALVILVMIRRTFPPFMPWGTILKSLLAATCMVLFLQSVQTSIGTGIVALFAKVCLGAVSYFLIMLLLQERLVKIAVRSLFARR